MKFTKMQGIGNDYVYINCFEETVENPAELSQKVSDRHFGIGSDGLILICPSEVADCRMRMFNADGSESQMCGNGIRCVGKYVYDHRLVEKTEFDVETKGQDQAFEDQAGKRQSRPCHRGYGRAGDHQSGAGAYLHQWKGL
jgi:diaminopimelate epimerase (EC 5.1.1.7)